MYKGQLIDYLYIHAIIDRDTYHDLEDLLREEERMDMEKEIAQQLLEYKKSNPEWTRTDLVRQGFLEE